MTIDLAWVLAIPLLFIAIPIIVHSFIKLFTGGYKDPELEAWREQEKVYRELEARNDDERP